MSFGDVAELAVTQPTRLGSLTLLQDFPFQWYAAGVMPRLVPPLPPNAQAFLALNASVLFTTPSVSLGVALICQLRVAASAVPGRETATAARALARTAVREICMADLRAGEGWAPVRSAV